jgi:hypothetical protein
MPNGSSSGTVRPEAGIGEAYYQPAAARLAR